MATGFKPDSSNFARILPMTPDCRASGLRMLRVRSRAIAIAPGRFEGRGRYHKAGAARNAWPLRQDEVRGVFATATDSSHRTRRCARRPDFTGAAEAVTAAKRWRESNRGALR